MKRRNVFIILSIAILVLLIAKELVFFLLNDYNLSNTFSLLFLIFFTILLLFYIHFFPRRINLVLKYFVCLCVYFIMVPLTSPYLNQNHSALEQICYLFYYKIIFTAAFLILTNDFPSTYKNIFNISRVGIILLTFLPVLLTEYYSNTIVILSIEVIAFALEIAYVITLNHFYKKYANTKINFNSF